MQGGPTTSPVLILNCPLWKLHSITSPSMKPSESKPGPWVQCSSITKNSPSRLKTASTRPAGSTLNALPGATSATPQRSIRGGADMHGLLVDGGRAKMPLLSNNRRAEEDATMESESARMSSAAEARFRIDYPNSKPRAVKVIALDDASEQVVKRVARREWQRATFFTSLKFDGAVRAVEPGSGRVSGAHTLELPRWPLASLASAVRGGEGWSIKAWLSDLAGRTKALVEEVASADLVVMVSCAGTCAQAAAVIGEACAVRKVMTMALIIGSEQRSNEELSKTLAALRPYASMLVIASGDEYIEEMLAALRA